MPGIKIKILFSHNHVGFALTGRNPRGIRWGIESNVEGKRRLNEVQTVERKSVNMQYARESSDFPAIDIARWVLFE